MRRRGCWKQAELLLRRWRFSSIVPMRPNWPVLEAARESVEGEIELARSLKVQTAQAKLSARIVTVMPFVLIALFSFMSPGFLDPFFASVPGMVLLALALVMQVGGVMLVRRTLAVGAG